MDPFDRLPVSAKLPEIAAALQEKGGLILRAAPGAGKTMLVPVLAMECAPEGKVILVEPRRVAARMAASGISAMHHWKLGAEAGFAVRGEQCRSEATRILAVTPGVLLKMLQEDPELSGVSVLIFDEFHERSAENDLAFTLVSDARAALRPELKLIVMSATLSPGELERFLPVPVIEAPGREFPVEIEYQPEECPWSELVQRCARTILLSFSRTQGDILVFLPGKGEIERCAGAIEKSLPPEAQIHPLHGSLSLAEQSKVLLPPPPGKRKVILATNIAESSLTIDGVRTVIDSGWERKMHYVPGAGMPFLEPSPISLASAAQRAGRAGRTAPGKAIRLWSRLGEKSRLPFTPPEILECDTSPLVMEVASWGAKYETLPWLTPPPAAAWRAGEKLLAKLGFCDAEGHLTARGKDAAKLPVHPRIAAMLLWGKKHRLSRTAACLAVLLQERLLPAKGSDLREYFGEISRNARWKEEFRRLFSLLHEEKNTGEEDDPGSAGVLLAHAYPEWIGHARSRHSGIYQLVCGKSAALPENDPLLREEFLAVADLSGFAGRNAAIRFAAPLSGESLRREFASSVMEKTEAFFDPATGHGGARKVKRLGEMILESVPCPADGSMLAQAVLTEALHRGLPLPPPGAKKACRLLERIRFAKEQGETLFPDWRGERFSDALWQLALPFLDGVRNFAQLEKAPWTEILLSALDFEEKKLLDKLYPESYTAPTGMTFPLEYQGRSPVLALPVQQLYGETVHPCVGSRRLPILLHLLSPAGRPVQITGDLPGFWKGSWQLVRTEMKSRYPKHFWPEDPASEAPMRRSLKSSLKEGRG